MNKNKILNYLLLLLILNISCVGNKSAGKEGLTFDVLSVSKSDSLKFTSGIRAIFQDSRGNYWFGSLREGVAVFDGTSFSYFDRENGLSDNQIHSIREDDKGVVWLDTQHGISSFDGSKIKNYAVSKSARTTSAFGSPQQLPEQGLWIKSDQDLWFDAGTKEGVYRYDGQQFHYLAFPPHKVLNLHDNLFAVTDISAGKHNMIWFATYAGVFGFDGTDFTVINDETLAYDRATAPLHIRSILEDTQGRLWIGNNGIGVLLKQRDQIANFSEEKNLVHLASGRRGGKSPAGTLEHVFTITEDRHGNIWFGDRDAGTWKFDGEKMKNYTVQDGLTNDFAQAIYEDRKGVLWFGMADGTVFTFNGNSFEKQF